MAVRDQRGLPAVFITIGPDVSCLFMSCLALSEDLAQKKHPANDLPWKHHNHRVCRMCRITDVLINAISVKKLAGPIVMKIAVKVVSHSLRHYISISIPGTCVNYIINPHQVFPTTQKKGVLLCCRGWLELVIWSFE